MIDWVLRTVFGRKKEVVKLVEIKIHYKNLRIYLNGGQEIFFNRVKYLDGETTFIDDFVEWYLSTSPGRRRIVDTRAGNRIITEVFKENIIAIRTSYLTDTEYVEEK